MTHPKTTARLAALALAASMAGSAAGAQDSPPPVAIDEAGTLRIHGNGVVVAPDGRIMLGGNRVEFSQDGWVSIGRALIDEDGGTSENVGALVVWEDGQVEMRKDLTVKGTVQIDGKVEATMGTVPKGAIMMWSGNPNELPTGWRLADGAPGQENKTVNGIRIPNLSGKFVVGYTGEGDYAKVDATGGKETVDVPNHAHAMRDKYLASLTDNQSKGGDTSFHAFSGDSTRGMVDIQSANDRTLENRPPYYVLAYIIYVGA